MSGFLDARLDNLRLLVYARVCPVHPTRAWLRRPICAGPPVPQHVAVWLGTALAWAIPGLAVGVVPFAYSCNTICPAWRSVRGGEWLDGLPLAVQTTEMRIRPATIADIDRCARLDGSYTTSSVWHMEEDNAANLVSASFRRLRLPRRLEIPYPRSVDDLQAHWKRSECFLIADEFITILGYLDLTVNHWQWAGFVEHLIVDCPYRRRGVARRLLQAAAHWGRGSGLTRITAPLQTKNDPAIRLLTSLGYAFSGFIEHYYNNGDVALFYSLNL